MAFAVPPYIQNRYGIVGPWCFVLSLNYNCTPTGEVIQTAFYGMYMALGVAGIVATVTFLVVYCKLLSSFKEVCYLLKRTLCVLVFKLFHMLMIMCSVACQLYTLRARRHELYGLWLLHAIAAPSWSACYSSWLLFMLPPCGNVNCTICLHEHHSETLQTHDIPQF